MKGNNKNGKPFGMSYTVYMFLKCLGILFSYSAYEFCPNVCLRMCTQYLQRPEEGVRSPGNGVIRQLLRHHKEAGN